MGKNAKPNVTMAPKNHMENQTFRSPSNEVNVGFSILSINSSMTVYGNGGVAKLYKFFHRGS
jgi:hypothetical protein